jgi:hypothetical protein
VVRGDVHELMGDARLSAVELINEGLAGGPGEERTDDVCVDDVREIIALLGEPADIVSEGLARLLLAALEVPRVSGVHVHPLEVLDEDLLELYTAMDAAGRQEFEPRSNVLHNANGEVLSGSAGESEIFQPYSGVRLLGVLGDVGGWSEVRREWYFLEVAAEGSWARAVRTEAPVAVPIARSATTPGGASSCSPSGWWASATSAPARATLTSRRASCREWMMLRAS